MFDRLCYLSCVYKIQPLPRDVVLGHAFFASLFVSRNPRSVLMENSSVITVDYAVLKLSGAGRRCRAGEMGRLCSQNDVFGRVTCQMKVSNKPPGSTNKSIGMATSQDPV